MADHLKPTITSTYSNFVSELDSRLDDLAVGLDPVATTATNVPVNSIRWSSASNKWQKFNGSAWSDLSSLFSINISGNAGTVTNGVYTSGSYADPAWITSIAGAKVSGAISGNAGSATQLATARSINGVAFNGTTAINVNLNNTATFNNGGAGAASGSTFNGSAALTISYNTVGAPSVTGTNATGIWAIGITGNAATVTNGVYTSGAQSIAGVKTFTDGIISNLTGSASLFNGQSASFYQTALGFTPIQQNGGTGQSANKIYIGWLASNQLGLQVDTTNFGNTWPIIASSSTKLSTAAGTAPSYSARAWVNFNGTGTVSIQGAGNVSSITDNGVGDFTLNFTTAMPDANYAVVGSVGSIGNAYSNFYIGTVTTSSIQVKTYNSYTLGVADCAPITVSIFR